MHISSGSPMAFGATKSQNTWNFAIFSTNTVTHLVLQEYESQKPIATIPLRAFKNKTGNVWHIAIDGLPSRFLWGWQVRTALGDRLAIDPYAHLLYTGSRWGENRWNLSRKEQKSLLFAVASEEIPFDWTAPSPSIHPLTNHIIYETHVRGFTKDSSSNVASPGTWSGYIEKLDHLQSLGVTALELLPIYEFDESEWPRFHPISKEPLYNFWGYSPLSFFSPMQRYSSYEDPIQASLECKKFINECHKRSLSVILDVVYNHTGEGNEDGPSYSFKLFSEKDYYITDTQGRHTNYSGCGNSFNMNHPVSRRLIVDSLKHWVTEYKVDGFRFDLAGSFLRSIEGQELPFSPLLQDISSEPLLASKLLILEPWDPCGIYKTSSLFREGSTRSTPYFEWNDRFRDDVRRFIRGDHFQKGLFATRISGSEDMYANPLRQIRSINCVTCHDGFSLQDLVSYSQKHNEGNAEENNDGTNENFSSNSGQEGFPAPASVKNLRKRQIKNFLLSLFLSRGIPMLHQGDEYAHTKEGNNNSWCQDNPLNWFQWNELHNQKELVAFVKNLIAFRKEHPTLTDPHFLKEHDIDWHGITAFSPAWDDDDGYVAFASKNKNNEIEFYAGFSASETKRTVTLPEYEGGTWTPYLFSQDQLSVRKNPRGQQILLQPFSGCILTWQAANK